MKIASIVGARPQFIKQASLSKALKNRHDEIIIHTGQHYDYEMSKIFFGELSIPKPDYSLEVGELSPTMQTAEIIKRLDPIFLKEKPDLVIVTGDTTSTMAGAIAANKNGFRIAHIESGMRSFDRKMPEEINRIVTDHISDILFCSTKTAIFNLANEKITKNVHLTGDILIDSVKQNIGAAEKKSKILGTLDISKKKYILATIHRSGNTDSEKNLASIISSLCESGEEIILPVHPRTRKFLKEYGLIKKLEGSRVKMINPLGYLDMLMLEKNAEKIITDSGGVQKEAYFFKVPCITARDSTEWTETVKDGWNTLTGANKEKILRAIKTFNPSRKQTEDYGNGRASLKILDVLNKSG